MANVVVFCFISTLAALQGIHAVTYTVTNNAGKSPGGIRFENEIGATYAKKTLNSATNFIWRVLHEPSPVNRKKVPRVPLFIETMSEGIAYSTNNEIHISASYIGSFPGNIKKEFASLVYHEMTNVWQWNGNGQTPGGLIEGIADYVRIRAGYDIGAKPGQGERWDQGYSVTAWFLDYCEGLKKGFVAELNKKMKDGYSVKYFDELLGKSVDQLWKDYKDKFNK